VSVINVQKLISRIKF